MLATSAAPELANWVSFELSAGMAAVACTLVRLTSKPFFAKMPVSLPIHSGPPVGDTVM